MKKADRYWKLRNKLTSVTYNGTVSQWNAIKGIEADFFGGNENVVVTCTDGTVTVNPSTTSGS